MTPTLEQLQAELAAVKAKLEHMTHCMHFQRNLVQLSHEAFHETGLFHEVEEDNPAAQMRIINAERIKLQSELSAARGMIQIKDEALKAFLDYGFNDIVEIEEIVRRGRLALSSTVSSSTKRVEGLLLALEQIGWNGYIGKTVPVEDVNAISQIAVKALAEYRRGA